LKANRLCTVGYTGVWVNDAKIAALGIHCKRYITYHGIALNCNTDLDWFNKIKPCGIEDKSVTSLSQQLNKTVTVDQVVPKFIHHFTKQFEGDYIESKLTNEMKESFEKELKI
jgi:lipoyl(octanoyl) transferase 2